MYYCVKENLCKVLFKSVSLQPLNILEKGAGKIVYPPITTFILPATVQLRTPWMSSSLEVHRGVPNVNVPKSKRKEKICYRYRIIISLSLCQTSMNWNGMYTSLSGCRSSGPILFCNYLFELKDWTFYM